MNDEEEHKFEAPQPPREKIEPKKPEKSSLESSNGTKKSSKSSSSSSSNHHHSSSSKQKHTNHLSSTNNHQSSSSSTNHHHHSEHKDKEHKKSHDSKSSESKHHKSHHTSSSSSHKTSNSHKRSREDAESKENESKSKKMKSDHEKSDKKSNGSNDEKKSSPTSNGTSSKSKKKDHKSSTKRKYTEDEEQEFDGTNGIGFAEALALFDMPSSSTSNKRPKHDQLADKMTTVKSGSSSSSSSKSKSSSTSSTSSKKDKDKDKPSTSSSSRPSTSKAAQNYTQPPKLLTQKPKLDLLSDIANELPSDVSIPDYRPLPLNSAMKDYINSYSNGSANQSRHTRTLTESELLIESFSSQKSRTRVYSGNTRARSEVPKLYEMCLRVLTDNLDYVECTGGVPFDILRPALEKAKPDQLANIEYYNPYLLDDSDILWKPHCQRTWKNRQPAEMESWRDMYERCIREDAEKLSRLTKKY
jgi:transcription elongation factor B polypeptide 3